MKLLICVLVVLAGAYGEENNPSQPQDLAPFGGQEFPGNESPFGFPLQPVTENPETATDNEGNLITAQPTSEDPSKGKPVPLDEQKQKEFAAAMHRQLFPPVQYGVPNNPSYHPFPALVHPFGAPYIPVRVATNNNKNQQEASAPNLGNTVEEQPKKNDTSDTTASVGEEVKLVVLPGASYLQPVVKGAAAPAHYPGVQVQPPYYYYYYGAPVVQLPYKPQATFPFGYHVTQTKK